MNKEQLEKIRENIAAVERERRREAVRVTTALIESVINSPIAKARLSDPTQKR